MSSGTVEGVAIESCGLVEERQHGDDLSVVGVGVFAGHGLDNFLGSEEIVRVIRPKVSNAEDKLTSWQLLCDQSCRTRSVNQVLRANRGST